MKILITGVEGFIGTNLAKRLLEQGHTVYGMDSYITGLRRDVNHGHPNFHFIEHDVVEPLPNTPVVDRIYHLASPASPIFYIKYPLKTMYVNSIGTQRLLEKAQTEGSRLLFASTSEVYGDPQVHPQVEEYWGNVNPIGPRSIYDEAKRYGEALCMAFSRRGTDVRIIRIFNTYGPMMRHDDGRVIPNFIKQALQKKPLTIYGDGSQTRSFCYVDDLTAGMNSLMESELKKPCNIGNPVEMTMLQLANYINAFTKNPSGITNEPLPKDDPTRRKPNISKARKHLNWEPKIEFAQGISKTVDYFREFLSKENLI